MFFRNGRSCPQSGHHPSGLTVRGLPPLVDRAAAATNFCIREFPQQHKKKKSSSSSSGSSTTSRVVVVVVAVAVVVVLVPVEIVEVEYDDLKRITNCPRNNPRYFAVYPARYYLGPHLRAQPSSSYDQIRSAGGASIPPARGSRVNILTS